jgi:hypothetical protein
MKLVILYNKIVIHDIKNNYTIFIYFAIPIILQHDLVVGW